MRTLPLLVFLVGCPASLSPFVDNTLDTGAGVDTGANRADGDDDDGAAGDDDDGGIDSATTVPMAECADEELVVGVVASGTTAGHGNDFGGSCGGDRGNDVQFSFTAPSDGRWAFELSGTFFDTALYVLESCDGAELACADLDDPEALAVDLNAGEQVVVVVDGAELGEGAYNLEATSFGNATEGACANGNDDDLDGLIDCDDPDCEDKPACSEDCGDGVDNTGNGLIDCLDPACSTDSECDAPCVDDVLTGSLPIAYNDTTVGGGRDTDPSCSPTSTAKDRSYAFVAPYDGTFTFSTAGSSFDTVIYVLNECGGNEIVCNDDIGGTLQSGVMGPLNAGQRVIVVVDGYGDNEGNFTLTIDD